MSRPEAAHETVSDLIKVLCKVNLQSIYGTKIAQNGTRNSTKQSPARPRLVMDSVWLWMPPHKDYVLITSRLRPAAPVMDATTG